MSHDIIIALCSILYFVMQADSMFILLEGL